MNTHKPTVIIPAYNESQRILGVLKALKQVAEVKEIIIVDDGSVDDTAAVIEAFMPQDRRIKLLRQPMNQGKGAAIFTAWATVATEYVVMLDGDLIGLHPEHIHALCEPVLSGSCDMTLGVFKGGDWKTDFSHWVTPWLSGQRCLRRDMLQSVSFQAAAGYGLETALTVAARQQGWKVKQVPLVGMSHPISEVHRGGLKGVFHRLKMYAQIVRAWYLANHEKPPQNSMLNDRRDISKGKQTLL